MAIDDPMTWTEADLRWLIDNRVEESDALDYKGPDALTAKNDKVKNDLSKDVSAFANAGGGTLVYGMTEDPKDKHLPHQLIGVDPRSVTKEWLEQVVRSRIEPRIEGLGINPVDLGNKTTAYVVVVPQSQRAPHMGYDNKYYKRYNFDSVAMKHYEVEDVRRRATSPRLSLELSMSRAFRDTQASPPALNVGMLVAIENESPTPAMYALVEVLFDMRIRVDPSADWQGGTVFELDDGRNMFARTYSWSVTKDLPVWQGTPQPVGHLLEVHLPTADGDFDLAWRVSSPGMQRQERYYKVRVLNQAARLVEAEPPQNGRP